MIWKETGVQNGSYMCFFNPTDAFRNYYYYMVSCGYFQCDSNYRVKDHGSRPPLFFFIISGSLEIDYEGRHHRAKANDVVLINCFHPQVYYCTDSCEFLFFHYDGNLSRVLTDELVRNNGGPVFSLPNAGSIYHLINEPIMQLCYKDQMSEAMLSSLVYTALCMIQDHPVVAEGKNVDHDSAISGVIRYINDNIQNKFTLQELADLAGFSPYYFSRLFKKETGHSPLDFIAISKINYAKLMLRTTTLSVAEIADFLGYSSSASFINAFRTRCGLSPKRYRKNATENIEDTTAAHP